nr:PREDICTED: kallikrein-15-like [Apteryx mantelli mantelli]
MILVSHMSWLCCVPRAPWLHHGLRVPYADHILHVLATCVVSLKHQDRVPGSESHIRVPRVSPRITSIRLGKHSLFARESSEQLKRVLKSVPHPDYDPTTKNNDIMMLKLVTPVTVTDRVQPIPLATCPPQPGASCVTSGWGATSSPEGTQCSAGPSRMPRSIPRCLGPLLGTWVLFWTPESMPRYLGPS